MPKCELLQNCIFFTGMMENMPAMSEMLKKEYCLKDSSSCARYMVYKKLGRENVPKTLFPHEEDRANEILNK